jgi:hypothetical protein
MKRISYLLRSLSFAILAVSSWATAALALTISPSFDISITSDPNAAAIQAAVNDAIQVYQKAYTDPITVPIRFQEMNSGVGASNWYEYKIPYQPFMSFLSADRASVADSVALAHLPALANNPLNNSAWINVKTANLHALGIGTLTSGLPGGVDGIISLNTHVTDIGSPDTSGQWSLVGAAQHEIDEILGLASNVGKTDPFFADPLPQDLFRYDASGARSFTTDTTARAYFSLDGATKLAEFNNQYFGGDFGDWRSDPLPAGASPKVQDAFLTPGVRLALGPELTALDVIGYNIVSATNWNVNGDGSWSSAGNWTGPVPNFIDATANFGNAISANRTVTLDIPQVVGRVNFGGTTSSYLIAGSATLTLDTSGAPAAINVTAGTHIIAAPLALHRDTVITTSAGTGVAITGSLDAAGMNITKAGAGSAQFENVRAASLNVTAGAARISAKGSPNLPAGTSQVNSLSIASGASLDLTNNSLVIDYSGPVGSLVGDVRTMLQSSRLRSSAPTAGMTVGYGDNSTLGKSTFGGLNVDPTSMLVKYTYGGDANLDGQVDVTDLGNLATNWQNAAAWTGGDFNYDGVVDVSDLGILATNWQTGVGSPMVPGSFDAALIAVGLGSTTVPESSAMTLAAAAAFAGFLFSRDRG